MLTGKDLKLTTPQDVLTARDTMEYWSQKHMAVGRGDATVTTNGRAPPRRRHAGRLHRRRTATSARRGHASAAGAGRSPAQPGRSARRRRASCSGSRRSATSRCAPRPRSSRGDRGVYVPDTGIARIVGHVHITRGAEPAERRRAPIVNMKTGIATLIADARRAGAGPDRAERAAAEAPGDRRKPPDASKPPARAHRDTPADPATRRTLRPRARCCAAQGGPDGAAAVGKTYKKRPVVRNVSVNVRRGEAVGLLGPNGAGKTTTFYMIVGLVRPDTGAHQPRRRTTSPACRCIAAPASASATCRRRPACSAASTSSRTSWPRSRWSSPTRTARDLMLRRAAGRIRHRPSAPHPGAGAVRRRAAPRRDRPRAGHPAELHPARRAAGRHRPDRGRRNPRPGRAI